MKRKNLNLREIAVINYRYISTVDKDYRIKAGMASSVVGYRDKILYLEIENTERTILSTDQTALSLALKWKNTADELKDAIGYKVVFRKRDARPGFMFELDKSKSDFTSASKEIMKTFDKINKKQPEIKRIYSSLFDDNQEEVLVDII